jgi:ketosteroid isomerase-like protein
MRAMFIVTLVLSAGAISGAADAPGLRADRKPDTERQLVKTEQNWNEAFMNRNKTALASLCADDFQVTDDDGKVEDKARYIEDATRHVKVVTYTLSNMTARAYGETGIVMGQWTGTVAADDGNTELTFRFTDTFVRREGRWWAVASQMTRLPAELH